MALIKTEEISVNIAMEERKQAIESIRQYNVQFLSSSAFITIISAIAGAAAVSSDNPTIQSVFYVLPTFYFLALYNLIKYSTIQQALGAYMRRLENYINDKIGENIIIWEKANVISNTPYKIFFAGVQIIYYIPVGLFIVLGFFNIMQKDALWVAALICTVIQFFITFILSYFLIRGQDDAERRLKQYVLFDKRKIVVRCRKRKKPAQGGLKRTNLYEKL